MTGKLFVSLFSLFLLVFPALGVSRDVPVYYCLQNRISGEDLSDLGISTDIVSVGGFALLWRNGDDVDQCLSYTEEQVRSSFRKYLETYQFKDSPDMFYLLDLESPIHPKNIHRMDPEMREKTGSALRMRLRVARELLPESKLSLYGIINADAKGDYDELFMSRLRSLQQLGRQGVFDSLDYITPVVYIRFGESDKKAEPTWEAMVRQGVEASTLIRKSNGDLIPQAVINSPYIYNGGAASHYEVVPPEKNRRIVEVLAEYEAVEAIIFWMGWDRWPVMDGDEYKIFKLVDGTDRTVYPLNVRNYFVAHEKPCFTKMQRFHPVDQEGRFPNAVSTRPV
jgi:hypothetical protein